MNIRHARFPTTRWRKRPSAPRAAAAHAWAIAALLVLALGGPAPAQDPAKPGPRKPASSADKIDLKKLADHIRKSFSPPAAMKLRVSELRPSPLAGYLAGQLEITEGERKQVQPVIVSADGRWYFLGDVFALGASPVPGFRAMKPKDGSPPPAPMHLAPDGEHVVYGEAKDMTIDPDLENLKKINLEGVLYAGTSDAPVVIVEYSDLQCPHCKRAHEILDKELKAYKGKVRRVFKHFPLKSMHPWAYDAAIAITCAARLDPKANEALLAGLFKEQDKIKKENLREKASALAEKAGLDAEAFGRCYDKKETEAAVDADIREAGELELMGTPSIFVNGRRARGYMFPEIKAIIDEMLAREE
ncbi:MAG: DsbA family protein [Elusimicrobiota bacterium]